MLVAPGATTHANDMQQLVVPLRTTPATGALNAVAPPTAAVAPPGWYMLFVLNTTGVPSTATWVHLG